MTKSMHLPRLELKLLLLGLGLGLGCGGSESEGSGAGTAGVAGGGLGGTGTGGLGGNRTGGSGVPAGAPGGGSSGVGGSGAGGMGGGAGSVDAAVDMGATADAAEDAGAPDMRPALATGQIPDPWKGEDIGMVGQPGGSGRNRRQMQLKGSGQDIWAENDAFHFLHRPISGDVELVARLVGIEQTNKDAKAGLMLRESTAADSRNVFMCAFPTTTGDSGAIEGKGTRLQFRDKRVDNLTGFLDLTALDPNRPDAAPIWLRLTRRGALFEGFLSADGLSWKKDGEITLTLPAALAGGLAVTAHTNDDANLARFESVRVSALTDPAWVHAELGTVGGFAAGAPSRFDLENAGRGIANSEDGITFVHRADQHLGDIELTARVTALRYAGNRAARIGLMLRGSMGADARMAAFVLELGPNGQRYRLQRRAQDGGNINTTEDNIPAPSPTPPEEPADAGTEAPDAAGADAAPADAAAPMAVALEPIWIKLLRVGHRFVGFISEDGEDWTPVVDLPSFVIASNAFVGVTLTSGTEGASAAGRIENVTISPPVTDLPVRPDAGTEADGPYDAAE